jgi:hypothetical protein
MVTARREFLDRCAGFTAYVYRDFDVQSQCATPT